MNECYVRWSRESGVIIINLNRETTTCRLTTSSVDTMSNWLVDMSVRYGDDNVVINNGHATLYSTAINHFLRLLKRFDSKKV